jgi:hypothetical protein
MSLQATLRESYGKHVEFFNKLLEEALASPWCCILGEFTYTLPKDSTGVTVLPSTWVALVSDGTVVKHKTCFSRPTDRDFQELCHQLMRHNASVQLGKYAPGKSDSTILENA